MKEDLKQINSGANDGSREKILKAIYGPGGRFGAYTVNAKGEAR